MKIFFAAIVALHAANALAQSQEEELAKKLSNPVSSLISVPFQYNYDDRIGTGKDGHKSYVNFQPVIPIKLNNDWNLISRTILPIVDQHNVVSGTNQSGIGDITQSLFFSPAKPTAGGLIWGAGPAFLLPSGTDAALSARKWGLGPTAVVLEQKGPRTYGVLANHIWSVAGTESRPGVSSTFIQPFLAHTTKTAWTYTLNAESTYDWKASQWSVPINLTAAKLMKFGQQSVSLGGGVRYWAHSPDSGPHNWGVRLVVTFLFPE